MDSGNSSGSMQSSSGGEDEYDSRAESSSSPFSALFFNNPPQISPFSSTNSNNNTTSVAHNLNHPLTQHHTPMFNPLSSYYLDHHQIQTPIPSTTTITTSTTSLIPNNHPISLDTMWSSKLHRSESNQSGFSAMVQLRAQNRGTAVGIGSFPATTTQQHPFPPQQEARNNNNNNIGIRNPKKRSRASRRAPTTVLTTDTTNFRAMVQEFTGIPAPPFTSSSPFPRTRLDLFGNSIITPSSSSPSTSIRSNNNLDPPPYLLRPFAQKIQPFSSSSSSSSISPIPSIPFPSLVPNSSSSSMVNTLLSNNNNNTIFSFSQQNYPVPQTNNNNTIDSNLKVGVFDQEIGFHLHNQNMVHSSSQGGGDHGNEITHFINGGEKGTECGVSAATARSEGMVESWINCSSE